MPTGKQRGGCNVRQTIRTWYDEYWKTWAACAVGDLDGLTLYFADTELEAYEVCYGFMVYNGLKP